MGQYTRGQDWGGRRDYGKESDRRSSGGLKAESERERRGATGSAGRSSAYGRERYHDEPEERSPEGHEDEYDRHMFGDDYERDPSKPHEYSRDDGRLVRGYQEESGSRASERPDWTRRAPEQPGPDLRKPPSGRHEPEETVERVPGTKDEENES